MEFFIEDSSNTVPYQFKKKKDQFNHHMDALLCSAQFAVSFVQQGTQADAIFWVI